MKGNFDTIIIGLGAMGSAASYQLAKRGAKVLGIDQFTPPHKLGSSHGDTRITRQAIGEGSEYVPLVLRSYEIWDEIERLTNQKILTITGGLIISNAEQSKHHGSNFFTQTIASAEKYHIPHSLLDAQQIQKRFPQFKLQGNERGYFENNAGYLRPELCIETQLHLAQKYGAQLALNEKVLDIIPSSSQDKVVVKTANREYTAGKAILSVGPWVSGFLGDKLRNYFKIYRQVLYWFDINAPISEFEAPRFPIWIWEFGMNEEDAMYGFPAIDGPTGGAKIASEQYSSRTTADTVSREVTPIEIQHMYQKYISPHFSGLANTCLKALSCLYTVTPDHQFVIDNHPDFPQIIIASPCSGHGFKHSAAIGEVLAQLAIRNKSDLDISRFSLERFTEFDKCHNS